MTRNTEPTADRRRLMAEERLIMRATEMLARAMELRGVNQTQLAGRLGVQPSFVSEVLKGERNITLKTLARFLDALDCDVDTIEEPREHAEAEEVAHFCLVGPRTQVTSSHFAEQHFDSIMSSLAVDISRYTWAINDIRTNSYSDPFHDDPYEAVEKVPLPSIRQASVGS